MTVDFLDTTTLAQIKSELTYARPDTATISRLSQTPNSIGEIVDTWEAVDGTLPCRLTAPGTRDTVAIAEGYPQVGASSVWRCTFADTADVRISDRVTIDSVRYDVIEVDDEGAWRTALRTLLHRPEAQ